MAQEQKQSWSRINLETHAPEDSLLSCLVLMTRYYNNPCSELSLIARLPVKDNKLTLDIFHRAAERAHLDVDQIGVDLDAINKEELPLILIMKDNSACLLIQDENDSIKIINPLALDEVISLETLRDKFSGKALHLSKKFKHSKRALEMLQAMEKNWFWRVILKSWPLYSEVLLASFMVNIFALVVPIFTRNVYDRVVPNQAMDTLWVLTSGVAIIFIFDLLIKTMRSYFIDLASHHSDVELSASIFQQVLGLRMKDRPKSVGSLANTVQAFEIFREFITSSTMTVVVDLPFVAIYLLTIYLIGGSLFWIPFLVVPVIFLIGFILQLPLIKLTQQSYHYAAEKQATLIEALSTIDTVKTTGAESTMQHRWEEVIHNASTNNIKLHMVANSTMTLTNLVQQIATIAVVIYGVYLIKDGSLTTGGLIACTILAGRAFAPMGQVAALFTRYYQSVNAMKSLNNIMQLKTDSDANEKYLHRPKLKGGIEFKQVEFNYQDEKTTALKNITFKIKAGEKVAMIGRVGSGKSTIARLILKLYEPTEGQIFLDGTDYRQINPDDLRQQIGYVPQDVTLFYGTVRDNICIGAPFVRDEELLQAAEVAGVSQFTNAHPEGFDRQVGERGAALSGGQRETVAIARALLLNPHLLVLDEPTSAMDDSSERQLKNRLKSYLTPEHTLILITHKMSMLELTDRIIVIDDGKVYADGSKDAVLNALRAGMTAEKKE